MNTSSSTSIHSKSTQPQLITTKPQTQSTNTTPKTATLLWIDLEMTGLDPTKDQILEVAALATDWDLNPIAEYTSAVKAPDELLKTRMVGPFWEKNAATKRALITQNQTAKASNLVEQELLDFIQTYFKDSSIEHDPAYAGKIILAGNSVHQDRKFIDQAWPTLSAKLHYRLLDVSAWKLYFEGAKHQKFQKREAHRALDDINGSIEELKWYLSFLK